jgi:hypothetical protein
MNNIPGLSFALPVFQDRSGKTICLPTMATTWQLLFCLVRLIEL